MREEEWGAVPHEAKVARLDVLQKLQRSISGEIAQAQVGSRVEVLVEGPSKFDPARRFGRSPENRTVNFDGDAPAGARVWVRIERGSVAALSGKQEGLIDLPQVAIPELLPEQELHFS